MPPGPEQLVLVRAALGVALLGCAISLVACEPAQQEEPPDRLEEMRRQGAALARRNLPPVAPVPEAPTTPLSEAERADVAALGDVIGAGPDPVEQVLVEVDAAVERDLPVRAAGILAERALPASQTLITRLREIDPRTDLGAALRDQWVAACTARDTALRAYAAALERGIVEDLTLADALRDQRRAGDAVVAARAAHAAALRRIDASAEGE